MKLVGTSVSRLNDPRMLTGGGRYVDDIDLPGMVHAAILRSTVAHGRIQNVDTGSMGQDDPNLRVVHALDAPPFGQLPCVWIPPEGQRQTSYPVLDPHVLYVGQPIGIVVAASRASAEDAIEQIGVDYDISEPVRDAEHALSQDAPLLHPSWGTNVAVDFIRGDPPGEVEAEFTKAAHVVQMRLRVQRVAGNPMETRGVVASWDGGAERLTVWSSTQSVHHAREHLALVLGLRPGQVRVLAPDVGGAFGVKEHLYPDEVLACYMSMATGRPVKWIEDRNEHFTATLHARDQLHDAKLALDGDGYFLAIWSDFVHDLGAHPSNVGSGPSQVAANMLPGPYRFKKAGAHARCVVTNRTPTGAYRGFGMQQATWVRERLVEEAARRLSVDPVELRRKNMLRRDELPCVTPFLQEYDSGDYVAALQEAMQLATKDRPGEDGRRRGRGIASYVEFTGLGPSKVQQLVGFRLNGYETSVVRLEQDGSVTVLTGVSPQGQGLETSLAQLAADALALPVERVRLVHGDTDLVPYSSAGTIASRSMTVGGGALVLAGARLREKIIRIAANRFEASPGDCELIEGSVQVKGDPATRLPLAEIAQGAWLGWGLPEGEEPGLEERATYDPAGISYSYATHIADVAVDTETGIVDVEGYWVAHDCGTIVNPMIVDGQVCGGVAQGIGIALLEEATYGEENQPLMGTYMDYMLPLTTDVPDIVVTHLIHPSPNTPGGMKGLGEGGTIGAPAAIGNAIANAVPEIAERITGTPVTPAVIWSLLNEPGEQ